jgi:transforming growth factor-beta-induced protein
MFKKTVINTLLIVTTFSLLFFASSCKDKEPDPEPAKSIAEIASADTSFSILVACLSKAGLVKTLTDAGTYTVFAPNNAAFRASGLANAASLTAEELKPILLYHVLGATVKSTDLVAKQYASTLSDGPKSATNQATKVSLLVEKGTSVTLNGTKAKVTTADITASNGVIHVIDRVILPVTIADLATNDSDFSSLLAAVVKGNLVSAVSDKAANLTVFGPINSAFAGVDLNALTEIQAAGIVTTHIIGGANVLASEVSGFTAAPVQTLNIDEKISLKISGSSVLVSSDNTVDATVKVANVQAVNGVVHAIDKVLLP